MQKNNAPDPERGDTEKAVDCKPCEHRFTVAHSSFTQIGGRVVHGTHMLRCVKCGATAHSSS